MAPDPYNGLASLYHYHLFDWLQNQDHLGDMIAVPTKVIFHLQHHHESSHIFLFLHTDFQGHLYSNANGKAQVEFYTSDNNTSYTISVTGLTAGGEIIHKKLSIQRK